MSTIRVDPPQFWPSGLPAVTFDTSLDSIYELGTQWLKKSTGGKVFDVDLDDIKNPIDFLHKCTDIEDMNDPNSLRLTNVWTIQQSTFTEELMDPYANRVHIFLIRGYYQDGHRRCARTFRRLIDNVCTEFRSHRNAEKFQQFKATICHPLQCPSSINLGIPFGEHLLFSCELEWKVEEEVMAA